MAKAVSVPGPRRPRRPSPLYVCGGDPDGERIAEPVFGRDAEFGLWTAIVCGERPEVPAVANPDGDFVVIYGDARQQVALHLQHAFTVGSLSKDEIEAVVGIMNPVTPARTQVAIVLAAAWPAAEPQASLETVHRIMQTVHGAELTAREIMRLVVPFETAMHTPEEPVQLDMSEGCPPATAANIAALGGTWVPSWWTLVRAGAYLIAAYG